MKINDGTVNTTPRKKYLVRCGITCEAAPGKEYLKISTHSQIVHSLVN